MSRCKSCDAPLKDNEIIWRPELHQHEELCLKCRRLVFGITEEDQAAIDTLMSIGDEHDVDG